VISQWYENRNDGCDGGMAGKLTKVIRLKSFASKNCIWKHERTKKKKDIKKYWVDSGNERQYLHIFAELYDDMHSLVNKLRSTFMWLDC